MMLRHLLTVAGAALALVACATKSAPAAIPLAEVPAWLGVLWEGVQKTPDLAWSPQHTPYFPAAWPPGTDPLWVRYSYAYGQDPRLGDAVRVLGIWARVELTPVTGIAGIVPLASKEEASGTQGVFPLPGASRDILARQEAVTTHALGLRALPDATLPATADLRAFYREW